MKKKQLILFTFWPIKDYNLQYIKFALFLLSVSLIFNINGFFYNYKALHNIYANCGIVNYIYQIYGIVFSSIIPSIINLALKKLSLSEDDILEIKSQKYTNNAKKTAENFEKCFKIKICIFYILSFLLLFFFLYFISCFCGVYNNSQIILITDTLISFGLSMIYPFFLNLIPGIFRIPALRDKKQDSKCLYKISLILSAI